MNTQKYISLIITLAMIGSFALMVPALAVGNQQGEGGQNGQGRIMIPERAPAVIGTVSAINGNTITVVGKRGSGNITKTTTFTIDATNAKVTKNGIASTLASVAVGDAVTVQGTVTGTNVVATTIRDGRIDLSEMDLNKMRPNLVGKISAINGNVLTVVSKQGFNKTAPNTSTTFTVDAANAKVLRGNTAITVSSITVGDTVIVQGTITGTNVVATMIRDGKVGEGDNADNNQALLQIQGDGQPVVAGIISAINGSTITITNNSNITYTINAANAKIIQGKNTISISGVKIGDSVIVQGAVNGTSVIASTIIDQTKPASTTAKPGKGMGFLV